MPNAIQGPAYRVHTERLVLRCWNPEDAPLLASAIEASLDHLWDWMPWTRQEPADLEARVALLRHFRAEFDLDHDFVYGIFNHTEDAVLGGTGLHTRLGSSALEIGYWIHAAHINQGLATETAQALTKVAFEIHHVNRIEIHCDPDNVRSAAVPKKLGYLHEATLRQRAHTPEGEPRGMMIWTMLAEEYAASAIANVEIEAFDVLGRKLL